MKLLPLFLVATFFSFLVKAEDELFLLSSPDKKIEIEIAAGEQLTYRVRFNGVEILAPSALSMKIENEPMLGVRPRIRNTRERNVHENVAPQFENAVALKDHYNELTLNMRGKYSVIFRAYNQGVAYRFSTALKGSVNVQNEEVNYNFNGSPKGYFLEAESFEHPYEDNYRYQNISEIDSGNYATLPLLVELPGKIKALITEADLLDYPGLYFQPTKNSLKSILPQYPKVTEVGGDRNFNVVVKEREDFIATTNGKRTFPWRVMIIAQKDKELVHNHLVYLLSTPSKLKDPAWVTPGKVAWDWWNALNLSGVDFKAGINTETYKYFIDFAAANNIEYVNLDEGWSDQFDLMKISDQIDIKEILRYAKQKNVKLILWCIWHVLDRQMQEAMDLFNEWGIAGVKVDFMNRDDQVAVNFYERLAKEAADRKMIVNFHGAFKPTGLRRTYPNVINREAVLGLEYNKWSELVTPDHDLIIPFIRMAVGPMDYTPGAMRNGAIGNFQPVFELPMSQGTRVHQLAMFVAYDAPLQMLADAPTAYEKEPEVLQFLSSVPALWDETIVLDGKIGEYLVMARRKGETWYVGAMTNKEGRELKISFDFLKDAEYKAEIFSDGVNAERNGEDYKKVIQYFSRDYKKAIYMAPGGGWVAKLSSAQ